jgi:hypothetical protein
MNLYKHVCLYSKLDTVMEYLKKYTILVIVENNGGNNEKNLIFNFNIYNDSLW